MCARYERRSSALRLSTARRQVWGRGPNSTTHSTASLYRLTTASQSTPEVHRSKSHDRERCKPDFNSQRINNGTGSSAVGGPLKQTGQVRAECWSRMTSVGNEEQRLFIATAPSSWPVHKHRPAKIPRWKKPAPYGRCPCSNRYADHPNRQPMPY